MIRKLAATLERFFTLIVVVSMLLGLSAPGLFLWVKPFIPFFLGMVMFGIGFTIRTEQLKKLLTTPSVAFLALGKFLLMPLVAFGIGMLLRLPQELLVGMVILGACPGGASANVMSYLCKANTSLTVMLTILTTLLSPLVTPWVIYFLLHEQIIIDMAAMMQKLFWVVIFPLMDAFLLRRFFARPIERIEWAFPPLSILVVGLIIGFVAAANRTTLLDNPWAVLVAVLLFNSIGYVLGYAIARTCRFAPKDCQSVAFEYGIQDSALGIIIATSFFTSLAALPSAMCSLVQNLTGPVLARWFGRAQNR